MKHENQPQTALNMHQDCGEKRKLKRLFERGDLQLLILLALQKQASHGYELIKSITHITNNLYEPSPGVVYPTLSMLEDQELILQDQQISHKKVFTITEQGISHLNDNQERIATIQKRILSTHLVNTPDCQRLSVEIDEAIRQFKVILRHQLRIEQLSEEQVHKIALIIRTATQEINTINESLSNDPLMNP